MTSPGFFAALAAFAPRAPTATLTFAAPPASLGSDLQGNKANLFVDAQASYHFNDNFTVIVEAQNLTDERNTLFVDSTREDTLFQTAIGRSYTIGATFKFLTGSEHWRPPARVVPLLCLEPASLGEFRLVRPKCDGRCGTGLHMLRHKRAISRR